MFFTLFEESVEKMAGDSTSTVKSVNPHLLRIDVVKFDSMKNFGVTPRSRGYGDVTVMYIRRAKIPSHIYAKINTGKNQSTKAQW